MGRIPGLNDLTLKPFSPLPADDQSYVDMIPLVNQRAPHNANKATRPAISDPLFHRYLFLLQYSRHFAHLFGQFMQTVGSADSGSDYSSLLRKMRESMHTISIARLF
jgi:hypothetical protein